MPGREAVIYEELAALWREVMDAPPPPPGVHPEDMLDVLVSHVQPKTYDRFCSPHLRASQISRPKEARADIDAEFSTALDNRLREMLLSCPAPEPLRRLFNDLD